MTHDDRERCARIADSYRESWEIQASREEFGSRGQRYADASAKCARKIAESIRALGEPPAVDADAVGRTAYCAFVQYISENGGESDGDPWEKLEPHHRELFVRTAMAVVAMVRR